MALRHEKVAEWYFRQGNSKQKQERAIHFLKGFLKEIKGQFEEHLLLRLLKQPELAANFIYTDFWKAKATKKANQTNKQTINQLRIEYLPVFTTTKYKLLTEIGHTFVRANQPKEALEYLEKALELNSSNVHPHTELGKVYQQLNQWNKAEIILLEASEIDLNHLHSRTELGKVYQQLKQWDNARKILLEAHGLDSHDRFILNFLAKEFTRKYKYHLSIALLNRVQQKNLFIICRLLELYHKTGNYTIREPLLQQGNKIINKNPRIKYADFFDRENRKTISSLYQLKKSQQVGHCIRQSIQDRTTGQSYPILSKTLTKNWQDKDNFQVFKSWKVKEGNKVFYNLYQHQETGTLYANFIEPHYEVARLGYPDYLGKLLE